MPRRAESKRYCATANYSASEEAIALDMLAGRLSVKAAAIAFGLSESSGMAAYARALGVLRRMYADGRLQIREGAE